MNFDKIQFMQTVLQLIWTLVRLANYFLSLKQNFLEYMQTVHCLGKFIVNK